jgi:hypothetical protein
MPLVFIVLFLVFNDLYLVDFIKCNISNLCEVHGLYNLSPLILCMPSALSFGLRPLAGWDSGSNSTGDMDVRLFSLPRADHSSRRTLPSVVCLSSCSFDNEEVWPPRGCLAVENKNQV